MIWPLVGPDRPDRYRVVAFDGAGNRVDQSGVRSPDPEGMGRKDCARLESELRIPVGGYIMLERTALEEAA